MSGLLNARVNITIQKDGSLSAISLVRSTGIPELDQAVLESLRRAAPFPELPEEWTKPVWSFTQEVQINGR